MQEKKRWYGCEEITIGFYGNGHGNEICDYILMDSKGIIRCYELKVTKQDLKSHAMKSWYGNYNYLVVTDSLYEKIVSQGESWNDYLPDGVGLMVGYESYEYIQDEMDTEMPDKNPNNPELVHGVYYTEKGYEVYKNGWNACREKFLQPDG